MSTKYIVNNVSGQTLTGSFGTPLTIDGDVPLYSNGFDGTQSISIPDSINLRLGDATSWTIETWIYTGAYPAGSCVIIQKDGIPSQNYSTYLLSLASDGKVTIATGAGQGGDNNPTGKSATSSVNLPLDQWVHLAAVWNGSNITLYQNGAIVGTVSAETTPITGEGGIEVTIGEFGNTSFFSGRISNLRIVKNSAIYTEVFTPPTEPLIPIGNTSLLTCNSSTINVGTGNATIVIESPWGTSIDGTWIFRTEGATKFPNNTIKSDSDISVKNDGIPTDPPTVIAISGADFVAVNITYIRVNNDAIWVPAGYNEGSDPYILFIDGEYGINVPGFGQPLYVNTGTFNMPLAQWNTNPPLGSIAPVGVYTYPSSYTKSWNFGADGTTTLPGDLDNVKLINSIGTYRALLTQTGSIVGTTISSFNYGLIVGEEYTITAYQSGDDFSNIADVQIGTINETGCVFIATGQVPTNWNASSELTSDGGLVVDVLENTLGHGLTWDQAPSGGYGYYVAYNSITGPIYNSFQRDRVEIITPLKYSFDNGPGFPPLIAPYISTFLIKDGFIVIDVVATGGPGDLADNLLYYTPIEIKVKQDTDTTPIEIYGEVIAEFSFSDVTIDLYSDGNQIQTIYAANTSLVNDIQELITLLNNDQNNVFNLIYTEGGPNGIMVTVPTNLKNQFSANGTLTFTVTNN
jgi:hypothetical protein